MDATGTEFVSESDPDRKSAMDVNKSEVSSANMKVEELLTPDGEEPTARECDTLRRVTDKIPWTVYLICVVEMAERFTFYGLSGPLQNYIQNPRGDPLLPGALALGRTTATGLSYTLTFLCYLTPIGWSVVADTYLGRYYTICIGTVIYMTGVLILFVTSLPSSLDGGGGVPGLIVAIILIGFGAGAIKVCIAPLICDQYTETRLRVKTLKGGERVILDPGATIQRLFMIFYLLLCIACLGGIPTTYLEKDIGFWAAFLLPFCVFWIAVAFLILGRSYYVVRPPNSNTLAWAFKAFGIACRNGFRMDSAKPSVQAGRLDLPWDDKFIDELKQGLIACRVFICMPIIYLCYAQITNGFVSQAGTMETHGLPNDILYNFEILIMIILIPVFDRVIYPTLQRLRIPYRPVSRIIGGLVFTFLGVVWAAILQRMIYSRGPCYEIPLLCEASEGGALPNKISVLLQIPGYFFFAISEIHWAISALEYAYKKAPESMKSVVLAVLTFSFAVGSGLGAAISPVEYDPHMVIFFSSLASVVAVTTGLTWFFFGRYDKEDN